MLTRTVCKFLMQCAPAFPDPEDPHLWEVFKTPHYLNGSDEHQEKIRFQSSLASFEYEQKELDSWLVKYFFPRIRPTDLFGKTLLDLGCYTGGRLIAWIQRYNLVRGFGLDINPIFKVAADEFASYKNVSNVEFNVGYGEGLPYTDNSIDFIVSTDVFEHVRDLLEVLAECHRVLKPGGSLLCVFPQYHQPFEAHLGMVTRMPALHWFFSSATIAESYNEIIKERAGADWYRPEAYPLRDWEVLFGLNGTTVAGFEKLIDKFPWSTRNALVRPILTDGRRSSQLRFKLLSAAFYPLAHVPVIREYFTGRINYILTK